MINKIAIGGPMSLFALGPEIAKSTPDVGPAKINPLHIKGDNMEHSVTK